MRGECALSTDLFVLQRVSPDEVLFAGIVSPVEARAAIELALGGIRVVAVVAAPGYEMLLRAPRFQNVVSRIRLDDASGDSVDSTGLIVQEGLECGHG
jgi:hypothetical protein